MKSSFLNFKYNSKFFILITIPLNILLEILSKIIPPKKLFFDLLVTLLNILSINFSFKNFFSLIIISTKFLSLISENTMLLLSSSISTIKSLFSSGTFISNELILIEFRTKVGFS